MRGAWRAFARALAYGLLLPVAMVVVAVIAGYIARG